MNYKKFSRIVNNPRHIPGIHNYCDRWCERCPLTLRCSVYAVEQVADPDRASHNRSDESLWLRLETLDPLAGELLKTHADHPGLPMPRKPRFGKMRVRPVDTSPVGAAAKRYMEFAHQFVTDQQKTLPTMTSTSGLPVSPAEAFDIIAFYHFLITVKLSRALHHDELDDEMESDPEFADMPKDSDGSAKITLIAIDRSILAWVVLSRLESLTATALPAALTLDRLRRNIEKHFPKARSFERPGFDTLRFK